MPSSREMQLLVTFAIGAAFFVFSNELEQSISIANGQCYTN